jgi:branched-chain amino acid transport system ATP-binding protein
MPLLEIQDLRATYGPTQVLHGLDLTLSEGGVTAILGANGAGKTTLLRALSGMVETTGILRLDGADMKGRRTEEIARLGVAHVPEGRGTFVRLTVEENLRVAAITRRDKAAMKADFDRVYGYFPRLRERGSQQAGTLSGGEQQMLAVGRALMLRPRLMLLDEPSFGLAPLVTDDIFRILEEVNQREKVGMLLVEQNASRALQLADNAHLIETGRIVMSGTARSLAADDSIRRSYLGY